MQVEKTAYEIIIYNMAKISKVFVIISKNVNKIKVVEMRNVLLSKCKHLLDMSSIQLDGIHTSSKRGGEAVITRIIKNM